MPRRLRWAALLQRVFDIDALRCPRCGSTLLIIDDLGMRKLPATAAEDLLEVIMRRYERGRLPSSPASRAALDQVRVVEEAVEHGGDGGGVAEQPPPVVDGTVGREQGAGPGVTKGVQPARLLDPRSLLGLGIAMLRRSRAQMPSPIPGREEPQRGPLMAPVRAQRLEQTRRQERHAVAGSLALPHAQHAALGVDVAHLKRDDLADA